MVLPVSGNLPVQPVLAQTTQEAAPGPTPSPSTGAVQSTPAPVSQAQVNDVLRDTGFKGEIDTSNPSQIIVRIVDSVTGKTVVQIPSVSALLFAEALSKRSTQANQSQPGALLDEAA